MKKLLIAIAALGIMLGAWHAEAVVNSNKNIHKTTSDFMKSKEGTWAGMKDGKMYWYKLDSKAKLWWSMDGKKWAEVKDGMWADKSGNWIKIGEHKLWWTADMGKTWSEVPEWKWEGPIGEWYKLDKNWRLWVNKMM